MNVFDWWRGENDPGIPTKIRPLLILLILKPFYTEY